ncbi:MAG: hypothetical protein ACYC46_13660 [Acidobacteriaceae bacterium]
MEITFRDLMTIMHGMIFGAFFLMAMFGLVVILWRSRYEPQGLMLTEQGYRWNQAYLVVMVLLGWAVVLSGAYVVYPWYRAAMPTGNINLAGYPQRLLMSEPYTSGWHTLGMEWKEHVSWIAPMAMTMVAYVQIKYKGALREHREIRRNVLMFAVVALLAAGVAGGFGALIDKAAPVTGGRIIELSGFSK